MSDPEKQSERMEQLLESMEELLERNTDLLAERDQLIEDSAKSNAINNDRIIKADKRIRELEAEILSEVPTLAQQDRASFRSRIAVLEQSLRDAELALTLAEEERDTLRAIVKEALPIIQYVSTGRGYVGVKPYPDASARIVNYKMMKALEGKKP